ncbi:MAG: prolyl oligopeptidase family serine peptidase [Victivallales bacterium]
MFLFITFIQLGQVALADEWADGKWNEKLTEPYERWTSVHDVLVELAQMAGVQDLAFTVECNAPNVVPLRAGLTLKEAFQSAAAMHLLEGQWESGRLTVRKTKKTGDWYAMIGGVSIPIILEGAKGSLLMPSGKKMKSPAPWVWYAPGGEFAPYHAWLCKRLLDEGISIARVNVDSSGSPKGRAIFTAFYAKITAEHGLARKAVLLPQSRGGLMLYNWAAEHPECVAAIGGIYTVCDLRIYPGLEKARKDYGMTKDELEAQLAKHNPIDRLEPLAKARIPLFHVHGDKDRTVPLEANSAELVRRYRALGGDAQVLVIPGKGHEVVREYFQCRELADFLIRQANATTGVAAQQFQPESNK